MALRDTGCRFTSVYRVHMHEIESRAMTRGRPPAERFNTRNCIMLAPDVHELVTRNVLAITPHDVDEGADGAVRFELRDASSPLWRAFLERRSRCYRAWPALRWESTPHG